ncbi:MAG: hypothetical protein AAGF10_06435 [Verrucomicrobiota bacterium]
MITVLAASLPLALNADEAYHERFEETAVDEEALERFLSEDVPEAQVFIERFEGTAYDFYVEELLESAPYYYREYLEVKAYDADLGQTMIDAYRAEIRTWNLAADYFEATTERDKEEVKEALRVALEEAFELKMILEEAEYAYLEKELQAVSKLIAKRKEAREKIIDRRLGELLEEGEEDTYAW